MQMPHAVIAWRHESMMHGVGLRVWHLFQESHTRISEVCRKLLDDDMLANELANRVFGENHATSVVARDKNGWKPTPAAVLDDIQNACVEHGHGGLWNTPEGYDQAAVMSIDMKLLPRILPGFGQVRPLVRQVSPPHASVNEGRRQRATLFPKREKPHRLRASPQVDFRPHCSSRDPRLVWQAERRVGPPSSSWPTCGKLRFLRLWRSRRPLSPSPNRGVSGCLRTATRGAVS